MRWSPSTVLLRDFGAKSAKINKALPERITFHTERFRAKKSLATLNRGTTIFGVLELSKYLFRSLTLSDILLQATV
jgi:hypothetical protein